MHKIEILIKIILKKHEDISKKATWFLSKIKALIKDSKKMDSSF